MSEEPEEPETSSDTVATEANDLVNAEASVSSAVPTTPLQTTLLFDREDGVQLPTLKRQSIFITPALARVFVRAASTAPTNDVPLSFSTLLVAMLADEDPWLKTHLQAQSARLDGIASRRPYNEKSLLGLGESGLTSEYLTSQSARAALEEATRIARLASGSVTVDMRHLCAAYPILWNWHVQDFAAFEIDRLEWARAFGAHMARQFPKEREYWRGYADRASPVPLASFSADVYTEEDLLGIDRGVDALALLIASTRTSTPLAIGVFGPWGSGKSFFMRHLQRRIVGIRRREEPRIEAWIKKRAGKTATADDAPLYFAEIAQVEFNAWHYNEGNLVASLVEHLFRNLRVLPSEGDQELAERRAGMLRQLKVLTSDLRTVDENIAAAQSKLDDAKTGVERATQQAQAAKEEVSARAREIEERNTDLQVERKKLDEAIQSIELKANDVDTEAVLAVALAPFEPLLGKVRTTLTGARNQVFDWDEFFARVFSAKGALVVALCVAAPLVLRLAHWMEGEWAAFMGSLMAVSVGFGNALDVLKRRRAEFERKLVELQEEEQRHVAAARAAIETQRAESATRAQADLDTLTKKITAQREALSAREAAVTEAVQVLSERAKQHDASLSERVAAEAQVRSAEAELQRLSSALLLEEFIKDRSSTDEYRKQLGFLALVRRDIERLSKLIDDANKRWMEPGNQDVPPLLNRIVLYIDDLDRCKETTVLAVLEAVHLLLAFPLFVCAVAVDPRWVEKCLRQTNSQLFLEEDHPRANGELTSPATVGDYLEKIFQIPIWMTPIESRTRATLVNSLLGPTAAPGPRTVTADRQGAPAVVAPDGTIESGAFVDLVAKAKETPDPLRISPEEAAFVEEIADLLSDRPRALKRFVNVYRLLKASLPDIERESFVTVDIASPHRICLSQLALFTGHSRLAPALVHGLEQLDRHPAWPDNLPQNALLKDWYAKLDSPTQKELVDVFQLVRSWDSLPLDAFRRWIPMTSRYLFQRVG
jgi:KAP family P-loop domain